MGFSVVLVLVLDCVGVSVVLDPVGVGVSGARLPMMTILVVAVVGRTNTPTVSPRRRLIRVVSIVPSYCFVLRCCCRG